MVGTSSSLVLIKPIGARGPLRFSAAEATTGDIPATIADGLGLAGRFPGQSMFRLDGSQRERQYLMYDDAERVWGMQSLPNLRRYRVRGDLFDARAWTEPAMSDVGDSPSALRMDENDFRSHAFGFGSLESQSRPSRWVTGTEARVFLSFPDGGKAQLALRAYVPPSIPGQSVKVSLNGHLLGELESRALASGMRLVMPVPDAVPRKKVNTIELQMAKAVKVPGDKRELAMVVSVHRAGAGRGKAVASPARYSARPEYGSGEPIA